MELKYELLRFQKMVADSKLTIKGSQLKNNLFF